MKQQWLSLATQLLLSPGLFAGARKIIYPLEVLKFENGLSDDLELSEIGYTKSKLMALRRLYLHQESYDLAQDLWKKRVAKGGYASVSFTCFNHLLKADPEKGSSRASIMGPCLQSIVITWLGKNDYKVDVFYRTTEIFKKFPADLIFLYQILEEFDEDLLDSPINFHFANVTVHPMYFVTVLANMKNQEALNLFQSVKRADERFHRYAVKWTASYLMDEHYKSIAKFAQAQRVKAHADSSITGKKRDALIKYLRKNGK